jgi:DNA-binding LacI/PurR family transcriptional regulator
MRIRLQDVADRTGVSASTVSRVMNDRPGVNERTRLMVLRVLAEMGYEPPALRPETRGGLVGLIVPELDNPIFPAFAQTIEARLAASGYTAVLCCATREGVHESEYFDVLLTHGVAGIVIVSGMHADTEGDHSIYRESIEAGLPLVFLNGFAADVSAPFVSCDDRHAMALAVRHLVSLGHERIGFITGPSRYVPVQRKLAGFQQAVVEATGRFDPDLVAESVFSVEGGDAAARALVGQDVTAVVAASDLMALGAIRAAHGAGLRVPSEFSVVGFDDSPFMAFTDPPLTTIRQPVRAMSERATHALIDLIEGRGAAPGELLFRPDLVVRGSTAAPGARRPLRPRLVGER